MKQIQVSEHKVKSFTVKRAYFEALGNIQNDTPTLVLECPHCHNHQTYALGEDISLSNEEQPQLVCVKCREDASIKTADIFKTVAAMPEYQ